MMSKARLDLPLPLGPVTTVSLPSGRLRSKPLRLFCRAPRTSMQDLAEACPREAAPAPADADAPIFLPLVEATDDNRFARSKAQIRCSNELDAGSPLRILVQPKPSRPLPS